MPLGCHSAEWSHGVEWTGSLDEVGEEGQGRPHLLHAYRAAGQHIPVRPGRRGEPAIGSDEGVGRAGVEVQAGGEEVDDAKAPADRCSPAGRRWAPGR
jgi:hypothetical protein